MGLDIKIPIGLIFTILGLLLFLFGLFTNSDSIYHKSLDININLWTGAFMLIFGIFMLLLSGFWKKKTEEPGEKAGKGK